MIVVTRRDPATRISKGKDLSPLESASFLPSFLLFSIVSSFFLSILLLARSYEMDGQGKENRKPDGRIEARVSFYNALYIYIVIVCAGIYARHNETRH